MVEEHTDPDFERVDALLAADDLQGLEDLLAEDPSYARVRGPRGESVVCRALYRGRAAAARRLAEAKRSLDLFELVALGREDEVADLVGLPPSGPDAISPDGFTLVQLAGYLARPAMVALLLGRGADPLARSSDGTELQALHAAVAGGDPACVELLLAHGVHVDARQRGGFTPLHGAAGRRSVELVRALLAAGADPSLAADDGRRAIDLVGDDPELVELLAPRGPR